MTPFLRFSFGVAVLASMAQAPIKDPLERARTFYNAARYDQAIEAATEARLLPKLANAASVVLARARLERYRGALTKGEQTPDDLDAARELLKSVDASKLTSRDHVDYLTGLGECLYLDDQPLYGAAASMFEQALRPGDNAGAESRESLFEWWAGLLDRQAQLAPDSERRQLYSRLLTRAEQELEHRPQSPSALYWIAAAARGVDDVERAWGAAVAGWIRAAELGPAGIRLRDDLDRLVTKAILPERARLMSPPGESQSVEGTLQTQWDDFKRKWK